MAQKSWPWSTVAALGDGAVSLSETISREFLAIYFGVQNPALEGVSKGVGGELAVSGTASPLAVAAGSGICYGLYINDAATTIAVTTPAVNTTGFRVVLQTNWAGVGGAGAEARTRIAVRKSADGVAAIPALVQTPGTTWEVSLATGTITTGGVIALTDARVFRRSTMVMGTAELDVNSITNTILRDSAALSVIGRAVNSIGDPADIAAGADDRLLTRVASALAFTQLTAGMFPAGVVATAALATAAVSSVKLRDSNALSVIGRAANSTGMPDDIAAASNDRVLARAANALSWVQVTTAMLATGAADNTIIRDSAALSVIGRAANSSGDPADIAAGADDRLLTRVASALAFTQLTAGMFPAGVVALAALAADSVDDTKAGNRVPQFYRRQGGNAASWHTEGTTDYTPTSVRQQGGSCIVGGGGAVSITFPQTFSQDPLVFLTPYDGTNPKFAVLSSYGPSGFSAKMWDAAGSPVGGTLQWFAVGPE